MKRPVVIVDPLSSGIDLAPAFNARGIPAIAVTLSADEWPEFGSSLRSADFAHKIADQAGIAQLIARYNPIAIIPGTEEGIPLAQRLTEILTPHLANDPAKSTHRSHKAWMQRALVDAGVPALKTLDATSEAVAAAWIADNALQNSPLVVKPPSLSGSEMVFHIAKGGDWRPAFRHILTKPSVVTGRICKSVVVQEEATGQEYAVGTVSADGCHYLAHLIKYHKTACGERRTVYDYVEFVPYDKVSMRDLFDYTQHVLDAMGVRWGAAHTEIMVTDRGPRLIETSARMIGGPVVGFARAATGSSQADKLAEIYGDGAIKTAEYGFKTTVVPVFLRAARAGVVANLEALDEALALPSFLSKHVWVKNGDRVPQTVDYLTSIGIIALTGEREQIVADYRRVRMIESKLVVTLQ